MNAGAVRLRLKEPVHIGIVELAAGCQKVEAVEAKGLRVLPCGEIAELLAVIERMVEAVPGII